GRRGGAEEERTRPREDRRPIIEGGTSGGTGTPGGTGTVSTGDSQLDRVARIDIDQIRSERVGGASSGMVDTRDSRGSQPGASESNNPAANINVGAQAGAGAGAGGAATAATPPQNTGTGAQPGTPDPTDKPKAT